MLTQLKSNTHLWLSTDASSTTIGAVLEQQYDKFWEPLDFFSKKLSTAQRKYGIYDRELLAAYLSTKHFLHVIKDRITILYTDHKPLVYIFQNKVNKYNDWQTRHISFLAQYFHYIEYIQSDKNVISDALSRLETVRVPRSAVGHQTASHRSSQWPWAPQSNRRDCVNIVAATTTSNTGRYSVLRQVHR